MSSLFKLSKSTGLLQLEPWLAKPWLIHGFTTRPAGDFARPEAATEASAGWGAAGMTLEAVRQIHSTDVHVPRTAAASAERPPADALLSSDPGRLLMVRTADCVPLLLIDESRRAVGAVHAGWRGTAQQIARRAVAEMRTNFGSRPADLEAAIGPAIGLCCYEVGLDVAAQFPPSSIRPGQPNPHLDLVAENRRQLLESGVSGQRIHAAALCTRCDPELFHSHRRDGQAAGRMLALVGIRTPGE